MKARASHTTCQPPPLTHRTGWVLLPVSICLFVLLLLGDLLTNTTPHATALRDLTHCGGAVWCDGEPIPAFKRDQMTFKPLIICKFPRCLQRVAKHGDRYCTEHARQYYKAEIVKRPSDPFYNTTKWRKLSKSFRAANPLCAECLAHNRVTAGTLVDHITPRAGGGADFDTKNLQTLCDQCHNRKRAKERQV